MVRIVVGVCGVDRDRAGTDVVVKRSPVTSDHMRGNCRYWQWIISMKMRCMGELVRPRSGANAVVMV